MTSAYPADVPLLTELGLRTTGFGHDWTDLGTVAWSAEVTVKVEVSAMPAMFWRFTITRPVDDVGPPRHETLVVSTGSGTFREFWPSALLVANYCLVVTQPDSVTVARSDLRYALAALGDYTDARDEEEIARLTAALRS